MARNPAIYGLTKNVLVAQSSNKGDTWEGVHDGLCRGRRIFVRVPLPGETIANNEFYKKGAVPVDMNGKVINLPDEVHPLKKQHSDLETPSLFD